MSRAPALPRRVPATSEAASAPAIEVEELTKSYGQVSALRGVSFTVPSGSIFGLLGPNGAGKSTLVKILTTLTRPDRGRATVAGIDVGRHPQEVRRRIGCVSQRGGLDLEATGRENLTLQGHLHGLRGERLTRRVGELLERFDLGAAADRVSSGYSGGMQRRLDVATGLVHRPQVLFLDEPTTGLDPEARHAMWEEISRLARVEQLTVLLTTHYLEEADHLAGQLAIVDRGRIVAEGTAEELKAELQGDAVIVELAAAAQEERVRAALARSAALLGAGLDPATTSVDGRTVRARAPRGARAVPLVLSALEDAGLAVSSVTVSRPSLDDVYLRHAGRAYASSIPATTSAPSETTPTAPTTTTPTTTTGGLR